MAANDFLHSFVSWRIWVLLAWQDVRLRYRRSKIGPFWITISMATMIYTMGFLYGKLFKMDLHQYFPFVAGGMLIWVSISAVIIESSDTFMEAASYIKQIRLPYTIYIMRTIMRNIIILLHNAIAVIPILIYFNVPFSWSQLGYLILGLFLLIACSVSYGLIFALIGTRFRDIKQVINSLVQVAFILTPIMWMPKLLPEKYRIYAEINPLNQMINLVRTPLTGHSTSTLTLEYSIALVIVGWLLALGLLAYNRRKLIFWI